MRLARKLADVPPGLFDRRDTGSLHKAISDDVTGLESFLAHMLPDAASAFSIPLAAMVVMFAVDWRMELASLAALPFAIAAQVSMLRGANKQAYADYHAAMEANERAVHEYLR